MQEFNFNKKEFKDDFLHEKHITYLLNSLEQTSPLDASESHRLSLLFFVISGLDLLIDLDTRLSPILKKKIIDYIYTYQVDTECKIPDHCSNYHTEEKNSKTEIDATTHRIGFAGFRSTSMIDNTIPCFDSGSITMTYCALATLVILGDDLERVHKDHIIKSINHLQLADGGFKPTVLGGESDMRMLYCAVAVSRLLDDWSSIDKDKCAKFIKDSLSYDGGFGQTAGAESHGGSTYCALGSLLLMDKLEATLNSEEISNLIRWCVMRLGHGFSGRPNKEQDTCYSFWIGACLKMTDYFKYIEQDGLLEFILSSQEVSGGFSKIPAYYSDPLHTYLSLAGLSFIDEQHSKGVNVKKLDPTLNISMRAKKHLDQLHKKWRNEST